jgi:endonuclease YncB( thermonuclease family)
VRVIEIKHSRIRRKAVAVQPSRIRREPPPIQKKVEPPSRETEIALGLAGVVLFALAIAFIIAGYNVVMGKDDGAKAAPVNAARFGSCDGSANCVIDGDTIRISGETVEIAGMTAPRMGSAARCPEEAQAGVEAVQALTGMLNSGKVTTAGETEAADGKARTTVLVNGKDVGASMVEAGLAHEAGSSGGWCG